MNKKKYLTVALAFCMILPMSIPALAADSSAAVTPPTTAAPADAAKLTPQQRADQRIAKLQKAIAHVGVAQDNQADLAPIKALQEQEKTVRASMHATNEEIKTKMKADRSSKNYPALIAGLQGLIDLQPSIVTLNTQSATNAADWAKLKTDRQANNNEAVTADLKKLETDVTSRLADMNVVLTGLQKVDQALSMANSTAPATTPAPVAVVN